MQIKTTIVCKIFANTNVDDSLNAIDAELNLACIEYLRDLIRLDTDVNTCIITIQETLLGRKMLNENDIKKIIDIAYAIAKKYNSFITASSTLFYDDGFCEKLELEEDGTIETASPNWLLTLSVKKMKELQELANRVS